jgi:Protein of unknown function (DUF3124)
MKLWRAVVLCLLLVALGSAVPAGAAKAGHGIVYAPIYQEAVIDHRGRILELAATLYVRNLDLHTGLEIEAVTLYDGKGRQAAQLLKKTHHLGPLASLSLLAPRLPAGPGAPSLLVRWRSAGAAGPPLVEVLMMGTAGQQGISLTTTGVPLPAGR